jgi:hypothetical protein
MFMAGYYWHAAEWALAWLPIAWLFYGQTSNIFYHYIWIKPDKRDYFTRTILGRLLRILMNTLRGM